MDYNFEMYEWFHQLDQGKERANDKPRSFKRKPDENGAGKLKGKQNRKRKRDGYQDWKNKNVELAGIFTYILKERETASS